MLFYMSRKVLRDVYSPNIIEDTTTRAEKNDRKKEMEGSSKWSVFDGVKTIPPTPESLMAEINTAVSALEYARATAVLDSPSPISSSPSDESVYNSRMADEAYKAGCAALAAGKLKEALQSLNLSLAKCPPDRTSAVSKLRSLISLTTQQLQRSSNKSRD